MPITFIPRHNTHDDLPCRTGHVAEKGLLTLEGYWLKLGNFTLAGN